MWCSRDATDGRQRLKSDGDCGSYGEQYHIVVVGAPNVGKTAICQTYVTDKDLAHCDKNNTSQTDPNNKKEFCAWDQIDGHHCCIRLTTLPVSQAPQVTPGDVDSGACSGLDASLEQTQIADGFLLIYSVTDKESFDASPGFYHAIMEMRNHTDTPLVFAGHKSDATNDHRHVSIAEGRDAAFDLGASFYETSVVSCPDGVKYLFHDVIRQVRAVRTHARAQEQACTRVRGFINRLSLKSKRRRRSRSRSRLALVTSSQQTL